MQKGNLWQYCRNEPNRNLANSKSLKFKVKIIGKTPAASNINLVTLICSDMNLFSKLFYYQFNRYKNICKNRYKTLCASGNCVNSR